MPAPANGKYSVPGGVIELPEMPGPWHGVVPDVDAYWQALFLEWAGLLLRLLMLWDKREKLAQLLAEIRASLEGGSSGTGIEEDLGEVAEAVESRIAKLDSRIEATVAELEDMRIRLNIAKNM
jgi:hypothetical protein